MDDENLQSRVGGLLQQIAIHGIETTQTARADGVYHEQKPYRANLAIEIRAKLSRLIVEHRVRH